MKKKMARKSEREGKDKEGKDLRGKGRLQKVMEEIDYSIEKQMTWKPLKRSQVQGRAKVAKVRDVTSGLLSCYLSTTRYLKN